MKKGEEPGRATKRAVERLAGLKGHTLRYWVPELRDPSREQANCQNPGCVAHAIVNTLLEGDFTLGKLEKVACPAVFEYPPDAKNIPTSGA